MRLAPFLHHLLPLLLQPVHEELLQLPPAPPLSFAVPTDELPIAGEGASVVAQIKAFSGWLTLSPLPAQPPLLPLTTTVPSGWDQIVTGGWNQVKHGSSQSRLSCTAIPNLSRSSELANLAKVKRWDGGNGDQRQSQEVSNLHHSADLHLRLLSTLFALCLSCRFWSL